MSLSRVRSREVLVVSNFLHPLDVLPIESILNGDVDHGRRRRCAVPVLFGGREPHDVAGPNLLDRAAPALRTSHAGGHDQRLTERMRVPGGPSAGFESDPRAGGARWIGRLE